MPDPIYPHGRVMLLPEAAGAKLITPTQVILHTAVDSTGTHSLYSYFSQQNVGKESTFFITNDGVIEQYMPVDRKADANRLADIRAVSIETEDDSYGLPQVKPWTVEQMVAIAALLRWLNQEWSIPLHLCPKWDEPGVGWHSMWSFSDPINQTGVLDYSPWTFYRGKVCPGKLRIRQLIDEILPALNEQDDMFTDTDREKLDAVFTAMFNGAHDGPMSTRIKEIHEGQRAVKATLDLDYDELAKRVIAHFKDLIA